MPRGDAHLWLAFILRAHHIQAQTLARRVAEAGQTWEELEALAAAHGLHERTLDPMYDAVLGYRTRRSAYAKRAEVTEQSATRDLAALTAADILTAHGTGRGRRYAAGPVLREISERRRAARQPIRDPYPWMRPRLAEPAAVTD